MARLFIIVFLGTLLISIILRITNYVLKRTKTSKADQLLKDGKLEEALNEYFGALKYSLGTKNASEIKDRICEIYKKAGKTDEEISVIEQSYYDLSKFAFNINNRIRRHQIKETDPEFLALCDEIGAKHSEFVQSMPEL